MNKNEKDNDSTIEETNVISQISHYVSPLQDLILARRKAIESPYTFSNFNENVSEYVPTVSDVNSATADTTDAYFIKIKELAKQYEASPRVFLYDDGSVTVTINSKIALGAFLDDLQDNLEDIIDDVEIDAVGGDYEASDNDEGLDMDMLPDYQKFEVTVYIKPEAAMYDVEGFPESDSESDDDFDEEDFNESYYSYDESGLYEDSQRIDEVKRKWKVNAKGARRIKMKCKAGFKWNGKACVKISGSELSTKRKATRQMLRTKKAKGDGLKRIVKRKTAKAKRFRKSFGLK